MSVLGSSGWSDGILGGGAANGAQNTRVSGSSFRPEGTGRRALSVRSDGGFAMEYTFTHRARPLGHGSIEVGVECLDARLNFISTPLSRDKFSRY
ncbi:hypothetical protein EI94DRAFT_1716121, partial [Lactarius quietus]